MINQTFATKYFPGESPLGQRVRLKQMEVLPQGRMRPQDAVPNPVFEIVGVISDAKNRGIVEAARPEVFVPYTITGAFDRGILV